MLLNTNTVALFAKCSPGANKWDSKSLEIFAIAKKSTQSGSICRMTSSFSGDSEIEASGARGYEISESSFHEKGWE